MVTATLLLVCNRIAVPYLLITQHVRHFLSQFTCFCRTNIFILRLFCLIELKKSQQILLVTCIVFLCDRLAVMYLQELIQYFSST